MTACSGAADNKNSNSGSNASPKTTEKVAEYTYEIVKTYNHDTSAFTQGLVFYNGFLYEGTGGRGDDDFHSSLRKVDLQNGKVLQKIDMAREYFGEGITILNGKIYQLTWEEKTAFVYDVNDFKLLQQFTYPDEGWGITHDGTNLIKSNGTHVLHVIDPENFQTLRTVPVMDERGKPIMELNELEYVKGEVWANIWRKGWIARIDPNSGKLLGRIDLNKLSEEEEDAFGKADVLNGIAYDPAADRLFITGKRWKHLFEIKVVPKP
jgi:glutamine cyclotransferase